MAVQCDGFELDPGQLRNNLFLMHANVDHSLVFALLMSLIVLVALWDGVWKVIGMWKSARNNQVAWFVCIAIFNTVGILPIIYLAFCQKDKNQR